MVKSTYVTVMLLVLVTTLAGCDGRIIAAGNLTFAVIPCVLLWITVNLKRTR